MSFGINIQQVMIASGRSQSDSVRVGKQTITGIVVPAGSALTSISFLGSVDNTHFYPIKEDDGTEYNPTVAASTLVAFNLNNFLSSVWVKVQAGSSGSPVTQSVTQTFILVSNEI